MGGLRPLGRRHMAPRAMPNLRRPDMRALATTIQATHGPGDRRDGSDVGVHPPLILRV